MKQFFDINCKVFYESGINVVNSQKYLVPNLIPQWKPFVPKVLTWILLYIMSTCGKPFH